MYTHTHTSSLTTTRSSTPSCASTYKCVCVTHLTDAQEWAGNGAMTGKKFSKVSHWKKGGKGGKKSLTVAQEWAGNGAMTSKKFSEVLCIVTFYSKYTHCEILKSLLYRDSL
jgi:hypothetical protein